MKWLFQADKAGHAGTLDPLASGMLPIALGEATKTVPYVQDGAKIYRFTVAWGEERSTDDLEGPVTQTSDSPPVARRDIARCCRTIPASSCRRRRNSRRSRSPANAPMIWRASGETVDIPAREVEIGRLDLDRACRPTSTVFEIECGKGTYVRSLARDMGRDLGCFGHIAELRRTEVDPFTAEDFVTIAELEAARFGEPADEPQPTGDETRPTCPTAPSTASTPCWSIRAPRSIACRKSPSATMRRPRSGSAIRSSSAAAMRRSRPRKPAPRRAASWSPSAPSKQGMFKPKRVFAG